MRLTIKEKLLLLCSFNDEMCAKSAFLINLYKKIYIYFMGMYIQENSIQVSKQNYVVKTTHSTLLTEKIN